LAVNVVVSEAGIARGEIEPEVFPTRRALKATDEQLERLQQYLVERNRGSGHDIVAAHRLMLSSPELVEETRRLIREEEGQRGVGRRRQSTDSADLSSTSPIPTSASVARRLGPG
jgi:phosphoenolpyruvate-protein kinase (PTS system EI component)